MLEDTDALHVRYRAARPGLDLLAVEDAALPVTVVQADVLAQERKALPLMNEFVLRLAAIGLGNIGDIASLCGLEETLVESAVADSVSASDILYSAASKTVTMTAQGRRSALELEAVQPVQKQLPLPFDRMTWSLADYSHQELISKREATELGMMILPASRSAKIGPDDVTVPGVNALLRGRSGRGAVEVLNVRKVRATMHRYLPVKLLVFGDSRGLELETSIVVDDELSGRHDLALAALGGTERLGLKIAPAHEHPPLDEDLEAQRVDVLSAPARDAVSLETVATVGGPTSEAAVLSVGVFEHPALLAHALNNARQRLLLISPWVRATVVDTSFLGSLERRLRAGCQVHIAHGFGHDDGGSDNHALERLSNLQKRYPDRFVLARLENTHAKILIFDGTWVSTSFNWLSFRGDPDRTYRMEEGTLVRIPKKVDQAYDRYLEMIEEQRRPHA